MILGRIILSKKAQIVATLTSDGSWKCSDETIEKYLNLRFPLFGKYGSPSMGKPGAAALHDAAEKLGGKVEYLAKFPEMPPGTIY